MLAFDQQAVVPIAFAMLGVAGMIVVGLVVRPGVRIDHERRRPGAAPPPSLVSSFATVAAGVVERLFERRGIDLRERLDLAGIKTPVRDAVLIVVSASIAAVAVGLVLGSLVFAVLMPVLVIGLSNYVVVFKAGRQRHAFANQLDETTQLLAGSIRSGYSLAQAVNSVAREAESPTAEEFARITNEVRVGRPLGEAMEASAARMQSDDMSWLSQAVAINREVGGNLADVLDNVGRTIRERAELRGRVKALSAEGRLSALILGGLPFVIGGLILTINPGYFSEFTSSVMGWAMLVIAGLLFTGGMLWLRAMVRIKF